MSAMKVVEDILREHGAGLWVVTGTQGDYSDQTWWIAAVCLDVDAAKLFVQRCKDWQNASNRRMEEAEDAGMFLDAEEHCPHDPRAQNWYRWETRYSIERVDTLANIPSVLMPTKYGGVPA